MGEEIEMKVVPLRTPDPDLTTDAVLHHAIGENLASVIVLGLRRDGSVHIDSSVVDGADAVWLLELAKGKALAASIRKLEAE
jgi:DNA-binding protein YbaB